MTMPTAPGAQVAGRLEVPVVADLTGFRDDLVDGVNKAKRGVEAEIPVEWKGLEDLRKKLVAAVAAAQKGVSAKVEVEWDTKGLKQRLQAVVTKAAEGVEGKVRAKVDDSPDAIARLRREFERAAERAAKGVSASVKVKVDEEDARKGLRDAFANERVRVLVDKDQLRKDIADAMDGAGGGAGGSGGSGGAGGDGATPGRPERPPRTTDPDGGDGWLKRFRARLATARAEAKAGVNVPVNIDPKSHFGNPPALRRVLRGALIGSVVSLIQPAIAAIGGLIVPLGALVGPLGQAVGSLGTFAPLLAAAVTAGVAGKVAFTGVGDALGALSEASKTAGKDAEQLAADQEKLNEALGNLSPSAQDAVREMFALKEAFGPIRAAVQERLFEKLVSHIEAPIRRALPVFQRGLELAAGQVGQLIADLSHLAGSEEFLRPLGRFFERLDRILGPLRRAVTPLVKAVVVFLDAAGPAAERLAKGFERGAKNIERMVDQGARTGRIADFLDEGADQAARLWRMVKNVGGALKGIAEAAAPAGNTLLESLDKNLRHLNEWANSQEGQKSIKSYLDDMLPVFYEMVGLIGDIGEALGRMARDPDTALLIKQIRDELVPALEKFLDTLGQSLGPAIVDVISGVVTLFANLGEAGGGIATAVQAIDELFDLLNGFLENHQTTATVLGQIVGYLAGAAILRVGLGLLIKPFNGVLGVLKGFGGKGATAGLAGLKGLFGLSVPSWLGGAGKPGSNSRVPEGLDGKDGKNITKTIQRVTWGLKVGALGALPVYIVGPNGGAGAPVGGVDGDGKGKPGSTRKPPVSGIRGRVAAGLGAAAIGTAALGGRLIGRKGKSTPTPVIPGSVQSNARRAAASAQGARALNPKGPIGKLTDLAKKVPGKGTVLGILGSIAVAPVAKAVAGDGKSTARRAAGGALSGAVNGAGIGALVGSVVPVVGTGIGAAAGGAAGAIYGGLSKAFPEVETKVKGWAAGLGGLAAAGIAKAGNKGKAFSWVAKNADEAGPAVGKAMGRVSGFVKNSLIPAAKDAGSGAKGIVTSLGSGLAGAGKAAADKLGTVGSSAKTALTSAGSTIKERAGAAMTGLKTAFGFGGRHTTSELSKVGTNARSTLTGAVSTVKERATTAMDNLKTALGFGGRHTTSELGKVTTSARTTLTQTASTVRERATNAVTSLTTSLGTAKAKATTKFGEVTTAARTQLTSTATTARERANNVASRISEGLGKAKGYTTTQVGRVKTEGERIMRGLVTGAGTILNGLKEKFAAPLRYAGNTVMGGLRTVFNKISGIVKGPQIAPIKLGFARGGVVPGYAPGKDTVPAMVSPGEGWLVPEAVRGLAKTMGTSASNAVQSINAAFSKRVKAPGGFATGGVVGTQRFHLGGLAHNIEHAKQAGSAVYDGAKGVLGKAGDGVMAVAGKVGEVFQGGMRAAFDLGMKGVNALLPNVGDSQMAGVGKGAVTTLATALGKWLTGKDQEAPAGGSPNGVGRLGPRAAAAHEAVRRVFGFQGTIGGYSYRANTADPTKLSKHALGKAIDPMTHSNMALGQRIANYFVEHASAFGVDNVIFNRRDWNSRSKRWTGYGGPNPHTDHPHIDFFSKGGVVDQIVRGIGGSTPGLGRGATVLPRSGGTLARIAESGRAESVVDTGKLNTVLDRIIAQRSGSDVVFQEGSVVVHNPAPEPASQSVQASLARVAAFGLFN